MTYTILVESEPGKFTPATTEPPFTGTEAEAQQHVMDLQATDGRCYAAQRTKLDEGDTAAA